MMQRGQSSGSTVRKFAPPSVRLIHLAYFGGAIVAIAAAATTPLNPYILNILVEAATYTIAVFGISVVLGLCGQVNLAQAAFFGLGAYAVGLGTADLHLPFWLCLAGGAVITLLAGVLLGMSSLRLAGIYLALVTISFQQIVTLVMTNATGITHGPDGVRNIGRPPFLNRRKPISPCALPCSPRSAMSFGVYRARSSAAPCAPCAITRSLRQ